MNQEKYVGMDVHQATISVAVMDSKGKLIMECILETKAATILEFIQRLHGSLSVTFEEGPSAAWLHDLLKPHVSHLVVCDPRKNALLKDRSKSDRIDARRLAELLCGNQLKPVYNGEHGVRTLKELGRSYMTVTNDVTRLSANSRNTARMLELTIDSTKAVLENYARLDANQRITPEVHPHARDFVVSRLAHVAVQGQASLGVHLAGIKNKSRACSGRSRAAGVQRVARSQCDAGLRTMKTEKVRATITAIDNCDHLG